MVGSCLYSHICKLIKHWPHHLVLPSAGWNLDSFLVSSISSSRLPGLCLHFIPGIRPWGLQVLTVSERHPSQGFIALAFEDSLKFFPHQLFPCFLPCLVIVHIAMPLNLEIPTQRFFCIQLNHGLNDKCTLRLTTLNSLFVTVFSKAFLHFLLAEVTVLLLTLYFVSLFWGVLFYFLHISREIKI